MRRINLRFYQNNHGIVGGESEDNKGSEGTIAKAEFDKVVEQNQKLQKDLEDMRLEVLSDDYTAFLDAKETKSANEKPTVKKEDKPEVPQDDFEKLSKKQIFEMAKKAAVEEITGKLSKDQEITKKRQDAETADQIKEFAKVHEDYDIFRPLMYGLSLDPKYRRASLEQLYEAAKAHVGRIHKEPDAKEKERLAKMQNEHPNQNSNSFEKRKNMSNADIAKEAALEVAQTLGPLPSA